MRLWAPRQFVQTTFRTIAKNPTSRMLVPFLVQYETGHFVQKTFRTKLN